MELQKKIIVSSFGVNTGGGLILLEDLLNNKKYIKKVLLDSRLKKKNFKNIKKIYVERNYLSRILIFIKEVLNCSKEDVLLCFNNLPPLIKPKCKTVLFLQNAFYVSEIKFKLKLIQKFKVYILRIIFNFFLKNVDEIYVQNSYLKKILLKRINNKKLNKSIKIHKILLLPRVIEKKLPIKKKKTKLRKVKKNFLYPATYDSHKNHFNLLKSFKNLSNINARLYLTLENKDFMFLVNKLNLNRKDLKNIKNLGVVSYIKLQKYYKSCNLIFPSYLESSGLPLYEGFVNGCVIFASNKNFVTDNFKNIITFNPNNYISIRKSIELGIKKNVNRITFKVNKKFIYSGEKFLKKIVLNNDIS